MALSGASRRKQIPSIQLPSIQIPSIHSDFDDGFDGPEVRIGELVELFRDFFEGDAVGGKRQAEHLLMRA